MKPGELCAACFEGHLMLTAGPGRAVRDIDGDFEVPAMFPLLRCERCGEVWQDFTQAEELANLKATRIRHEMARRAVEVKRTPNALGGPLYTTNETGSIVRMKRVGRLTPNSNPPSVSRYLSVDGAVTA